MSEWMDGWMDLITIRDPVFVIIICDEWNVIG